MCGTSNLTILSYCQACGMLLRPTLNKAKVAPAFSWGAPTASPPVVPTAFAGATLPAKPSAVAAQPLFADFEPPTLPRREVLPPPLAEMSGTTDMEGDALGITDMEGDALEASVASVAPRARRSRQRWGARICLVVLLIAGEIGFAYRSGSLRLPHDGREARDAFRAAATAVAATGATGAWSSVTSAATTAPAALPPASARAPPIPLAMGLLNTANAPPGHRIFVDRRTVGQTPQTVLVKCGQASVKIGSAGHPRALEIPCGKEISVSR
jgi:serine/threonine-protein kinase